MRNNYELGVNVMVKKDLPYTPHPDDIFIVDGEHTIKVERWRVEYFKDFINGFFNAPSGYVENYGALIIELMKRPEFWTPYTDRERHDLEAEIIDKFDFKQYLLPKEPADNLRPSIFIYRYRGEDYGEYHHFIQFEIDDNGLIPTLNDVLLYMDECDKEDALDYDFHAGFDAQRNEIIVGLNKKIMQLESYIRECERKLSMMDKDTRGFQDAMFMDYRNEGLYISKRGKFFMSRNGSPTEQEIRLSPLDKAVYLLFLRHPEGINFSYLPDYREELLEIYNSLMNYRTSSSMQRSIDDLTDPTNNSINEKCARIRRAFVSALGKYKASSFIIAGPRGGAKKITLDRHRVYMEK